MCTVCLLGAIQYLYVKDILYCSSNVFFCKPMFYLGKNLIFNILKSQVIPYRRMAENGFAPPP